jgi:hypothetical protein
MPFSLRHYAKWLCRPTTAPLRNLLVCANSPSEFALFGGAEREIEARGRRLHVILRYNARCSGSGLNGVLARASW